MKGYLRLLKDTVVHVVCEVRPAEGGDVVAFEEYDVRVTAGSRLYFGGAAGVDGAVCLDLGSAWSKFAVAGTLPGLVGCIRRDGVGVVGCEEIRRWLLEGRTHLVHEGLPVCAASGKQRWH
jgi:hypothetical protein